MKNHKGLTLVELVVSITLLSVIILGAITVLDFGGKSFDSLDKTGQIQTDAYKIITIISTEIRECRRIQVSGDNRQLDLIDKNTAFRFEGASLSRIDLTNGNTLEVVSSNIQALEFSPLLNANGASTVGAEVSIQLGKGDESYSLSTKIYQRPR